MRLSRVGLHRYGKFTGHTVEFPAAKGKGKPDFHLVVGENEAGKSTLRSAITDLLFGIELRSPFSFLHPYAQMCLGGVISHANTSLAFRRYKKAKNPLTDETDEPIPDASLAPFLGGSDREFFERMFGLDHTKLVKGGDDILTAKDDVARTLFQASSGLGNLGELRDSLESEARTLWTRQRSRDRMFYRALNKFKDAEQSVKGATVLARHWRELSAQLNTAQAELDEAREAYEALERERARLERIRRVAPHLDACRAKREERAVLETAGAVRLPPHALAAIGAAEAEMAEAEQLRIHNQALADKAKAQMRDLSFDETVLAHAADIEALDAEKNRLQEHPRELAKANAELAVLRESLRSAADQLGLQDSDEEVLEAAVPSQTLRSELRALMQSRGRLEEAHKSTARSVADHETELREAAGQLAGLSSGEPPVGLAAALKRARNLADISTLKDDGEKRIRRAELEVRASIAKLSPWGGTVDELRRAGGLSEAEVREQHANAQAVAARLEASCAQLEETTEQLESLALRAKQLQKSRAPVTRAQVDAVRAERGRLWERIKKDTASLETRANAFEAKICEADALADQRYASAADAKELEQMAQTIEQQEQRRKGLERRVVTAREHQARWKAEWASRLTELNLPNLQPLDMLEWLARRRDALNESDALQTAELELKVLEDKESKALASLKAALCSAGIVEQTHTTDSLEALIALAETHLTMAERAKERQEQLEARQLKIQNVLQTLQREAQAAQSAMAEWQAAWRRKVVQAKIAPDLEVAGASAALDIFADLSRTLEAIRAIKQTRIAVMEADLDAFEGSAVALAASVARDLKGQSPADIATGLMLRYRQSEAAKSRFEQAQRDLEESEAKINEALIQQRASEAAIEPLMAECGVSTLSALREAMPRAQQLQAADDAIALASRNAVEHGDGLSLEQLEREVAAEELATITARLDEIGVRRAEAGGLRDARLRTLLEAQRRSEEIGGQADAAQAESVRQEALSEMADITERFIKTFVGARLLRWSIDRYREEKQGPLLRRASTVFTTLTHGSFEALMVDFDGDTPRLIGRRAGGHMVVDVEGMSDGTRDQLYLALRLAAVELHLDAEGGHALPFIADDLFINYDDVRSASGFAALAALAKKTQVIFLTHHEHLVPIARDVLGKGINVVQL